MSGKHGLQWAVSIGVAEKAVFVTLMGHTSKHNIGGRLRGAPGARPPPPNQTEEPPSRLQSQTILTCINTVTIIIFII